MTRRLIGIVATVAILVAVLSCGGSEGVAPTSTAPGANSHPSDSTLLAGLYASSPVADGDISSDRVSASRSAAANVEVSWVSLVPGTIRDGMTATIVNRRTAERDTTPIVDGGFDPLPIRARLGDTIEVTVSRTSEPETSALLSIAARPRPRIVRSRPPRGQTDTPLNTIITLVFSEPLDPATVNTTSITLATAGAPVAGTVRIQPGSGYTVEFAPTALLEPLTTYTLAMNGVATVAGTQLDASTPITFTTSAAASQDSVVAVRFDQDTATVRAGDSLRFSMSLTHVSGSVSHSTNVGLYWSSSAPDVAYVDWLRGTVIGVGPGTATIYAFFYGGDTTITARVTVTPAAVPMGAIIGALCSDRGEECGLYAVDPDGSRGRFITSSDADDHPVWSPDGRWIAFLSQRSCMVIMRPCHSDLYVMPGDGSGIGTDSSNLRSLTAGAGLDVQGASWSPDGRRLVFAASASFPAPYVPKLYVVNADGTGLQQLLSAPPGSSASWPDWSPDGSRIAYELVMPGDTSAIDVVNADGTNDVRLSTPSGTKGDHLPRWSPDGKRIAFARSALSSPFVAPEVFVMSSDGSNVTQATHDVDGVWSPAWSPDGGSFALFLYSVGNLGVINANGTGEVQVRVPCCGYHFISTFSWRRTPAAVPASSKTAPSMIRVRP